MRCVRIGACSPEIAGGLHDGKSADLSSTANTLASPRGGAYLPTRGRTSALRPHERRIEAALRKLFSSTVPPRSTSRTSLPLRCSRVLTAGEREMAVSVFGAALDVDRVRIVRGRFFPLQPRQLAVAPNGRVYFHPDAYREDFSRESVTKRAWLVHELAHVMQHQHGMRVWLRALFDRRYDYRIDGRRYADYGVEQQASLFEHAYLASQGVKLAQATAGDLDALLADVRLGSCELRGDDDDRMHGARSG